MILIEKDPWKDLLKEWRKKVRKIWHRGCY